ncbi:hypothetical protein F4559_001886 [Saccharothrix violaceirubra]|uniref:Uncharacterized protein n=1 Tax=Saccharothrix violaceirubra TaxID=413306 RepID=A0A7W7T1V7_9PSEU|nr:hypothetical protein [Saccharothrix violaceirubra]
MTIKMKSIRIRWVGPVDLTSASCSVCQVPAR